MEMGNEHEENDNHFLLGNYKVYALFESTHVIIFQELI